MDVYNDFQRMARSDNIAEVIDRHHIRIGRDCTDNDTKQSLNEMRDVLDSMKKCRRKTYPALIKFCKYCASFTVVQLALFLHIISGNPLISFANGEGITEQAAQQMWERIVAKNPDLANIRKRRRKNEHKRTSSGNGVNGRTPGASCNILEQSP
ncbi:MAG: hypothetical protein J6Q84_04555 [Kiritimatiellae bacterium]|nr:hypothetical protein [Kiritimatiellia bacterium]